MSDLNICLLGIFGCILIGSIALIVAQRLGFFLYHPVIALQGRLGKQSPIGLGGLILLIGVLGATSLWLIPVMICHAQTQPILPMIPVLMLLFPSLLLSRLLGVEVWRWLWVSADGSRSMGKQMRVGALALLIAFPTAQVVMNSINLLFICQGITLSKQLPIEFLLMARHHPPLLISLLLVLVILTPILEELFFRGFLQSALRRYLGRTPAIFITAICFGLAHFTTRQGFANVPIIGGTFVLGCFLGYLFERERALIAPVTLHVVFNAIGVTLALFSPVGEG